MDKAVLLIGFGAPENKSEIKDFLYNLFCDPYIFKIPVAQRFIAKIISLTRSKLVLKKYEKIGGGSPYNLLTYAQATALQEILSEKGFKIFTAFQYHKPFIEDVLKEIIDASFSRVIVLPLYPQYSTATTGSAIKRVEDFIKENSPNCDFIYIKDFHNNYGYINALKSQLQKILISKSEYQDFYILFSAHSIQKRAVKDGDPYTSQVEITVRLVMEKLNCNLPYSIAYQSKVGYGKWLTPDTKETIIKLFNRGVRRIIVVPISFICEHFETLYQIDYEFRNLAKSLGYKEFIMMTALNDNPEFIESLANIILSRENGKI